VRPLGQLALVLHAHLPFVRHPEQPRQLEEHWLFEAITDSYLPLYRVLRDAAARGSRFRLTLSLSPTLLAMLADPLLKARYRGYLDRLLALCGRECARGDGTRRALAAHYQERLVGLRALYEEALDADLIGAFAALQREGVLELMTTAATHGYLPLLRSEPAAVRAQLRVARDAFRDAVGVPSPGLWLPECGWFEGLEEEVRGAGFRWCVLDAHGLGRGAPAPAAGVHAPLDAGGLAVFGRDPVSAREVWSRETGYPGHPDYREYHRDIGLEPGAPEVLGDFLPPGVAAAPTGLKYHRVTGSGARKAPYDPAAALARARHDAATFVACRRQDLAALAPMDRPPILVAPYDAELFGHWWYEGPEFLAGVIAETDAAPDLEAVTLGGHLAEWGTAGGIRPAASSWGEHGYNGAWLRPETGWVWVELHRAAGAMAALLRAQDMAGAADSLTARALRQAARSLLLAQSSDWTFHLGRSGAGPYAERRLRDALARFGYLTAAVRTGAIDPHRVAALESMDSLFKRLDLRHFV
jgi:1,4-alpha-glucan branching enzyme